MSIFTMSFRLITMIRFAGPQAFLTFAFPLSPTDTTHALTARSDVHIITRERMTVIAMCLTGVLCSPTYTAQNIYAMRDRLKVAGAHAQRIAAKMIQGSVRRQGAIESLPQPAMSIYGTWSVIFPESKTAVATAMSFRAATHPNPALAEMRNINRSIFIDLLPEPFIRIARDCHGRILTSIQECVNAPSF